MFRINLVNNRIWFIILFIQGPNDYELQYLNGIIRIKPFFWQKFGGQNQIIVDADKKFSHNIHTLQYNVAIPQN